MTWQFTLTGLGLGLIVGLTGVGGGSLMTPILIILFGFKPTYAVGTDIFHGAVFKSFGAIRHRRLGTVHGHLTLWLFAGSGPLAIVGVATSYVLRNQISNAQTVLGYIIGAALIGGGGGFLAKSLVTRGAQGSELPFILSRGALWAKGRQKACPGGGTTQVRNFRNKRENISTSYSSAA